MAMEVARLAANYSREPDGVGPAAFYMVLTAPRFGWSFLGYETERIGFMGQYFDELKKIQRSSTGESMG